MTDRRKTKKYIAVNGRRATDVSQEITYEEMMGLINGNTKELVDLLRNDFNKYVDGDINWKKDDAQWKKDAQPAIDNMKNMTGVGKTIFSISLWISAVIGALFALKHLFHK